MKSLFATVSLAVLALAAPLSAQEPATPRIQPCLVVARYRTDGPFFYRDQYEVPIQKLQLWYSADELTVVMKAGIKIVVYDTVEHESFSEARQSCFLTTVEPQGMNTAPPKSQNQ